MLPVELAPGTNVQGLVLTLRLGARITGEVFDAAGRPEPDQNVNCGSGGSGMAFGFGGEQSTTTDSSGRFVFEHVTPGKVTVSVVPSEEEIMELVNQMGGAETALQMIFEGMKNALNPDKAQDCIVGFRLTEDGNTHTYTVTIKGKQASYEKAEPEGARVVLGMTMVDYLRLIAGELDGMQAFMQGKLKLEGDMMFAQQIPLMFGI